MADLNNPIVPPEGSDLPVQDEGAGASTAPAKAKSRSKSRSAPKARAAADSGGSGASHEGHKLVIVESPAKAKTINKFLGRDYKVEASWGHVRDLPKKKLGIDVEKGFAPEYVAIADRRKNLDKLKKLAKTADRVFLALDLDREGEAIAWHLKEFLGLDDEKASRVVFNEITKPAILKAFQSPGKISMDKVNAQQARRILDRLVGYKLSPLLWQKVFRGLSAGRVQSVAVKLIVEREREIEAFKPEEYWAIEELLREASLAVADREGKSFRADLKAVDGKDTAVGKNGQIRNEAEAQVVLEELRGSDHVVSSVERKEKLDRPKPPFITSTLQQAAANRLGYSAKKTMMLAQQLYEGMDVGAEGAVGLITYMRTDSFNLSQEALNEAATYLKRELGEAYVPEKANVYRSRKGAQEAHEAIRPTSALRTPDSVKEYLNRDQMRLYDLIWRRFVASQMTPAIYDTTRAEITAGRCTLVATGRIMTFPGYSKVWAVAKGDDDEEREQNLPPLSVGMKLDVLETTPAQKFTQPPPRYNEASLVRTLEKEGIGRPSTYASIISTIQDRGYVEKKERRFYATELGKVVTEKLDSHFPHLMDVKFTSKLEEDLDTIEEAHADWVQILEVFYKDFSQELERAESDMTHVSQDKSQESEYPCALCGRKLIYKWNRRDKSRFLACPGYPDCKYTCPIDEEGKPFKPLNEATDQKCEKCGAPMVIKTSRTGRFLACSAFPNCRNTKSLDEPLGGEGEGGEDGADGGAGGQPLPNCEKCGKPMVLKRGRFGPFLSCSGYPDCKQSLKLPKELAPKPKEAGVNCPDCGKPMVIRSGRRGPFVACTGYPKCKKTMSLKQLEAHKAGDGGAGGETEATGDAEDAG